MKRPTLGALFCALAALLTNIPASAAPCAGFTDVDTEDPTKAPFCTSVEWMKNRAITLGCTSTLYCPDDYVTRLQMAAFMYRLGFQNAFLNNGNAFGTTAVLGTTDDQALDVRVNGSRAMRYEPNAVSPNVVGGSSANFVTAGVRGATISGGGVPTGTDPDFRSEQPNIVTDVYGTIGGGSNNWAGNYSTDSIDAAFATVAGGRTNRAMGSFSTVGGGQGNNAHEFVATIAGGEFNTVYGPGGTIGGGVSNTAFATATIAGGNINYAEGIDSTVGGGLHNSASGTQSAIAGGYENVASGPQSTVVGGERNVASGAYSLAMGRRAKTGGTGNSSHAGAFVFSDSTDADFSSTFANEFAARATGGVRFVTAVDGLGVPTWTCGVSGGAGGSWGCSSDRNLKSELIPLDGPTTLSRLAELPIYKWVAKDDERRIPHAGPTAQDFKAAFGLGDNDKMIGFADAQGVLFSALQGLNAKLEAALAAKDAEIVALRSETSAIKHQMADLLLAVEVLMMRSSGGSNVARTR